MSIASVAADNASLDYVDKRVFRVPDNLHVVCPIPTAAIGQPKLHCPGVWRLIDLQRHLLGYTICVLAQPLHFVSDADRLAIERMCDLGVSNNLP